MRNYSPVFDESVLKTHGTDDRLNRINSHFTSLASRLSPALLRFYALDLACEIPLRFAQVL